jgi:hypothetical protein
VHIAAGYVSAVESLTRPYDGMSSRIDIRMLLFPEAEDLVAPTAAADAELQTRLWRRAGDCFAS